MAKKGSTTQAFAQLALKLTSGDKEDIRGMKMADGRHMFSVYDIMWNTGAYESRDAVTGAWTRLMQSKQGKQICASFSSVSQLQTTTLLRIRLGPCTLLVVVREHDCVRVVVPAGDMSLELLQVHHDSAGHPCKRPATTLFLAKYGARCLSILCLVYAMSSHQCGRSEAARVLATTSNI